LRTRGTSAVTPARYSVGKSTRMPVSLTTRFVNNLTIAWASERVNPHLLCPVKPVHWPRETLRLSCIPSVFSKPRVFRFSPCNFRASNWLTDPLIQSKRHDKAFCAAFLRAVLCGDCGVHDDATATGVCRLPVPVLPGTGNVFSTRYPHLLRGTARGRGSNGRRGRELGQRCARCGSRRRYHRCGRGIRAVRRG